MPSPFAASPMPAPMPVLACRPLIEPFAPDHSDGPYHAARKYISETLDLLSDKLTLRKKTVRAGDVLYQAGEEFGNLYVLNSGFFKIVNFADDGREQVVALKFRGDWLGFDGIAHGHHACDAVAMDTGEVWVLRYDALLAGCALHAPLMALVHQAMSREIACERNSMMSLCTLSADARVAEFLRYWVESLARRGMRTDQITLRMTRAEIGNYLGMTLETVSRALSKLAKHQVIAFAEKGRRDVYIPDVSALTSFVQRSLSRGAPTQLQQIPVGAAAGLQTRRPSMVLAIAEASSSRL